MDEDRKVIYFIGGAVVLALAIGIVVVAMMMREPAPAPIASTPPVSKTAKTSTALLPSPAKTTAHPIAAKPAQPTAPTPVPAAAVTAIATPAPVAKSPPKPFRGIDWGSTLLHRPEMNPQIVMSVTVTLDDKRTVEIANHHVTQFHRAGDKLQFGPESVGEIEYCAFDDHFYEVSIGRIDPFALSAVFSEVYGPAEEFKLGETRNWDWKADDGQTSIHMFYDPPNRVFPQGFSHASISNVKLAAELHRVQKAEGLVELSKAKKDF